jgi:hypothetical protein
VGQENGRSALPSASVTPLSPRAEELMRRPLRAVWRWVRTTGSSIVAVTGGRL